MTFPNIWTSPLKGGTLDQIFPWIFPPNCWVPNGSGGRPGTWRTPCATWAAAERPWNSSGATSAKPWTAWMWRSWRWRRWRRRRWSRRSWWLYLNFEGVGWYFWRNLWIISYNIIIYIILIELSIYELNYPLRSYWWLMYLWLIFWSCVWDILVINGKVIWINGIRCTFGFRWGGGDLWLVSTGCLWDFYGVTIGDCTPVLMGFEWIWRGFEGGIQWWFDGDLVGIECGFHGDLMGMKNWIYYRTWME